MDDDDRRAIVKRDPEQRWETAIDHAIREALARGDFDDVLAAFRRRLPT